MDPILSICIPTYNRCQYLKQSLEALVTDTAFDDEVEIVISDNCSSDETERIGHEYAAKYSNIKYFRNEENVRDTNFCLALDRATGQYAKLMNDNHIVCPGGLHYIKEHIRAHLDDRKALFFSGGHLFNHPKTDTCECVKFEDFIVHLSYFVTAIHCFGAWREDWAKVTDRTKYTKLLLNQDDWSYQVMENRGSCIIYSGKVATSMPLDKKYRSGYNWFQVHVANYYEIMQPYVDKGLVSKQSLSKEKKTYLKHLKGRIIKSYLPWLMPNYHFDTSGKAKILWNYFKTEPYFHFLILTSPIWGPVEAVKIIGRKLSNHLFK